MTIEQIDETRVLIALGQEDMTLLSLEYETMSFKNPDSKKVLKKLITLAKSKFGYTYTENSITIEALRYDTGCLLVLTLVPKGQSPKRYRIKKKSPEVLYTLQDSECLLELSSQLYRSGFLLTGSSVIEKDNIYFLKIKQGQIVPEKALRILQEYSLEKTTDKTQIARICENGQIIAEKHPILHIGSAMCK